MMALITGNLWRAAAIVLLTLLALQTARIEGFLFIDGFKQIIVEKDEEITSLEKDVKDERDNHNQTKSNYRAAQALAKAENLRQVAEKERLQQEVTADVSNSFRARIADLQQRVRDYQRARADASGSSGAAAVPGLPDRPGRADGAPGDLAFEERVVCIEQAIQLDELITWVERQQKQQ